MPRICYVIMPFSKTNSCSGKQWTSIYETLYKKGVEEAGLDYECRRSTATRGNIIRGIIQDLDESYVVIADLTDRNPNVFYELGIRHSFSPRTILIAQKRNDIPFDLREYASHIYNWKTTSGRKAFKKTIKVLLEEIDKNPERPDNPVSDFSKRTTKTEITPTEEVKQEKDKAIISIVGPGTDKLNIKKIIETFNTAKRMKGIA